MIILCWGIWRMKTLRWNPRAGRRHVRPVKSPFDPSWTCFLQQGCISAENSSGFCSFWFLRVPTWTREWNRFPDTGQLGWFQMLSSALSRSDLPDSRAAGACRLGHRVAVGNQRDGSRQLETRDSPPPRSHFLRHVYIQRPGQVTPPSVCSTMSTVTSLWKWLHFLTKNMEQKVRTQDRKMRPCSQSSLGWRNTELLSHQAGESDPCFWLDHVSIWARRCLP